MALTKVECSRLYRKRHPERIKEQAKKYHKKNYEKNKEKLKNESRTYRIKYKKMALHIYGGKCAFCGEDDFVVLSIDHINDDGVKERKKLDKKNRNTGWDFYRYLIKQPKRDDLQVLCFNCQRRKIWYGRDFSKWEVLSETI